MQLERQGGMSGASLGGDRNVIIPQPHPEEERILKIMFHWLHSQRKDKKYMMANKIIMTLVHEHKSKHYKHG